MKFLTSGNHLTNTKFFLHILIIIVLYVINLKRKYKILSLLNRVKNFSGNGEKTKI